MRTEKTKVVRFLRESTEYKENDDRTGFKRQFKNTVLRLKNIIFL